MTQTVVGIITKVINDEVKFLLVKSNTHKGKYQDCWYPPGGHIEQGETEVQALARELKEELNLGTKPIRKLYEGVNDLGESISWWLTEIYGDLKLDSNEIKDAGFFSKQEVLHLPLWPATRKFFEENEDIKKDLRQS